MGISYFDQNIEQSNDTYENAQKPQRSTALTIVELRCADLVSHPVVTADRRPFYTK